MEGTTARQDSLTFLPSNASQRPSRRMGLSLQSARRILGAEVEERTELTIEQAVGACEDSNIGVRRERVGWPRTEILKRKYSRQGMFVAKALGLRFGRRCEAGMCNLAATVGEI